MGCRAWIIAFAELVSHEAGSEVVCATASGETGSGARCRYSRESTASCGGASTFAE